MNILLTLFLLFLVIVLLLANLKYRNKFQNYYDQRSDNDMSIINYIKQRFKYVFELKNSNHNIPVKFFYFKNN
jgi:hypothetical protein